ncbi:MAG: abortive infection family protein [Bacteroidales bacterium]|nr:abortive infection family protein [Bacteroidales bacterium]
MNDLISPKYQMKLVQDVEGALWALFSSNKYKNVRFYIEKWHIYKEGYNNFDYYENFTIYETNDKNIDLQRTLHSMDGEILLKIAIDLGIDTPDFIPSIPMFKNELKANYTTAYDTFIKSLKQIETDPSISIGLANSALESIIKEILKDERLNVELKGHETLYDLTNTILKAFAIYPELNMPKEIKTIGSSLLAINKSIEELRSNKTHFHGKTNDDYIVNDSLYAYFIINNIASVGLFLNSIYKKKFPKIEEQINEDDYLPF